LAGPISNLEVKPFVANDTFALGAGTVGFAGNLFLLNMNRVLKQSLLAVIFILLMANISLASYLFLF
tara:strand:+ start:427 stop:627 length:201 start_codon:yes stop_codon:yes gene_type:complete